VDRTVAPLGRPVVVKVGSSSLTSPSGGISAERLKAAVEQVVSLREAGFPTVLVTSAAVAAGLPVLGVTERPTDLASFQVAAAVGQTALMQSYVEAFKVHGLVVAQVLLTRDILSNREQYLHSRRALERMLSLGVVPVINENDTVVVDELKLGDNDRLAAIVSHLVSASLLVLLTDTAGLYSSDPRTDPQARLLDAVAHTDQILDEVAGGVSGPLGSGGVSTKVSAARMAAWSGIPTVIAPASTDGVALAAARGEDVGTWVAPHQSALSARKLWIAFGLPSSGTLTVDDGAALALTAQQRSLLPVGVIGVEGTFDIGAAVEVVDTSGSLIAKGRVRMSSQRVAEVIGRPAQGMEDPEVIHRDDLVVLA